MYIVPIVLVVFAILFIGACAIDDYRQGNLS